VIASFLFEVNYNSSNQDTAGQERFSALSSAFFRGADAAIIVYDVRRPKSLAEVALWWRAFADKCPVATQDEGNWPVVVVGNKIDLLSQVEGAEDAVWRKEEARDFVSRLIDVGSEDVETRAETDQLGGTSPQNNGERSKAVNITLNGLGLDDSLNGFGNLYERHAYPINGTYNSSRTGNTIYHTPSSSVDGIAEFHSAASSFHINALTSDSEPTSRSSSRARRRLTIDTLSSSSVTITPSLYARGLLRTETLPQSPRTPSIRHPPPESPEKGAKLLFASAKSGEGVYEVFDYIARRTVRRLEWLEANFPFGESVIPVATDRTNLAQFGALNSRCC
jgi:Ras-related protein Rab-7A